MTTGTFGRTISEARKSHGMTQSALAELCAISAEYISQIESQGKIPSDVVVEAIATNLSLPIDDLRYTALLQKLSEKERALLFREEQLDPELVAVVKQMHTLPIDKKERIIHIVYSLIDLARE
jgi:transcriptional regulator with XRE-family HTH domain